MKKTNLIKIIETTKVFIQKIIYFTYDYMVTLSFLILILFKLNNLYDNILSPVEIFLIIGIITILGSSLLKKCGQYIIASFFFQWLLFHFLKFKNILYLIIDDFLTLFKELGKIGTLLTVIWMSGFLAQVIWIFFFKTGFYFQLHFFIPMFFLTLFNKIERLLIFNTKNIEELQKNKKELDFEQTLFFLGTPLAPRTVQKKYNQLKLTYIQKRYISWSKTIPNSFKYLIPIGGGIGFSAQWYLNYQEFSFQKESFHKKIELEKKQFEFQKEQAQLELTLKEKQFEFQQKQYQNKSSWKFW
jgi:hypothetical protein